MELISNEFVLIALTFGVFYAARRLQMWTGWIVLNPILLTMAILILFLRVTGISYDTYEEASGYITFWIKPAIVAMGVPLYLHLGQIRRLFLPIFLSQLMGCLIGIVSVVTIAGWLGASREVIISLAPKSVTTPIAMEICATTGGIPSLTVAIVGCVGLLGAIIGFKVMELSRVSDPRSQGLAIGTASHAIGTAAAMEKGNLYGAYSSLGLVLNGVLTAMLTPSLLRLLLP